MATIREQIARHTRSEATMQQQPVADDPLAPTPIHFDYWRDADGTLHRRPASSQPSGPEPGWHGEDDPASDAGSLEPPPQRQRGQAYTPSLQPRDYQQSRVTRAYHDLDEEELLDGDDGAAYSHLPRSAIRYQHTLPGQYRGQVVLPTPPQQLRRQRLTGNVPSQQHRPPRRRNKPWSLYLVTGMLAMTALVVGLNSLGSWWQHVQDDWTYGYPRTFQTDAVVGHDHDSSSHPSHFLALNLRGQVEVFELPAGDPTKVRVFLGPTISGDGADQVVVTISFADINHDGTPDLILHYGDSTEVLYNKGGTFQVSGEKS